MIANIVRQLQIKKAQDSAAIIKRALGFATLLSMEYPCRDWQGYFFAQKEKVSEPPGKSFWC
jgi:hypothetical protein